LFKSDSWRLIGAVRKNIKMINQNKIRCHVETAIAVVGGKWKPWILWHLYDGVRRFGELQRLTPGITHKMLAQHLRELERDGVVGRKVYAHKLPKVEYSFTKYGETLRPSLKELCDWGAKHGERLSLTSRRKGSSNKKTLPRKSHQNIRGVPAK
jgi:DNA-binding HxlR family transcriptional regulator